MTSADMDALMKLRRFCFLGSFAPVYTHMRTCIQIEKYFPIIEEMLKPINCDEIIKFLRDMVNDSSLVRRDEVLFVYATYLGGDIKINHKTDMRIAFCSLIKTEEDLFGFCKYSSLISKHLKRTGFSRTVRKAIKDWYKYQTPETLRNMWMTHRGLYGFTHRVLIKLCHISDQTLGPSEVSKPFFKTCSALLKETDWATPVAAAEKPQAATEIKNQNDNKSAPVSQSPAPESQLPAATVSTNQTETAKTAITAAGTEKSGQPGIPKAKATHQELISGVSILRTTKKNHDALKIIRKYKLKYNQVPGHLLNYAPIMTQLLPTMTHFQIFKCWRRMAKNRQLENNKIFKLCKSRLENRDLAKELRLHPVHFLMNMRKIGIFKDVKKLPSKKVQSFQMDYMNKLYMDTFQWNIPGDNLRMHVTINLQSNYKKKFLKTNDKVNYYEACLALAFGYAKREQHVDVFHWYEDKMKLKKIVFEKTSTAELAFNAFDVIQNPKNYQRLVTPIMNALASEQPYDVFLCIVPTAGRGNPKQNSDFLAKFLDKYREKKNPNAKFIILNLLKLKRSMAYSETRNENILEICGLDQHTPDLIHNFAKRRFE